MAHFDDQNRDADRWFVADGVRWMGQNTNHLALPPEVVSALHESVSSGEFSRYAPPLGFERLRAAILADLGLRGFAAMITDGGAGALYNACQAFLRPGDHFVTTEPGWKWPPVYARAVGADVTEIDVYEPAVEYRLTADRVEQAVSRRMRMLYLVDPNNPLGTCIEAAELRQIAEICRAHQAIVIQDCTYQPFAEKHTLLAPLYPEGTLTIYTFSKWLGTAGLRVGAIIGAPNLIKRLAATPANSLGSSVIGQRAAMAGLQVKPGWFPEVQRIQRLNQARIKNAVDSIDGLCLPVYPSEGNYLVVECIEAGVDPEALAAAMANDGFIIRAGKYHTHRHGDRFVKVSTSVPPAWVDEFCDALPALVERLRCPRGRLVSGQSPAQ